VRCAAGDPRAAFLAGPSAVLGAYAAFGGVPYAYDAVSETPIVALRVATTTLTDIIEDHFDLGLRALSRFAQEEVRLMELKASRTADGRSAPSARRWTRRDRAALPA
jgi:CRP-like cAMP-binding protein